MRSGRSGRGQLQVARRWVWWQGGAMTTAGCDVGRDDRHPKTGVALMSRRPAGTRSAHSNCKTRKTSSFGSAFWPGTTLFHFSISIDV
jgi:hypothetical protein